MSAALFCVFIAYLGVSNGAGVPLIESLPSSAFTSSSYHDGTMCIDHNARRSSPQAWCPRTNNPGEYLQIDLGKEYEIVSVSAYPRAGAPWTNQYVKTYTLSYSTDGKTFTDYPKTLNGPQKSNTGVDKNDEVNVKLDPPIANARYLKFTPLTFNSHKSMRVEAYGGDVRQVGCSSFQIDRFLSTCSSLYSESVDDIRNLQKGLADVNTRIDKVIKNIGDAWDKQDLSSAAHIFDGEMPVINDVDHDINEKDGNKNDNNIFKFFNGYRDYLIVLSLTLNILTIGYILCVSINSSKKYQTYQNVKYVDSSDNENAAINM